MDPRLSTRHGFTHTLTHSLSHTHTHTHTQTGGCSDSDAQMLHLCHVQAQTPQKSVRGAQLQQHPLLLTSSPGCTCLSVLSLSLSLNSVFSSLLFCSVSPSSLVSLFFLSLPPSVCLPLSPLLVLHLTERQTETDAFVGDRIRVCVCVLCMCVHVCVRACTASTN